MIKHAAVLHDMLSSLLVPPPTVTADTIPAAPPAIAVTAVSCPQAQLNPGPLHCTPLPNPHVLMHSN